MKKEFISNGEKQTYKFAQEFAKTINKGAIILLDGDLGAGKTVFAKGFVSVFDKDALVVSPTFTIINSYGKGIYHFDLYRIESPEELMNIGADEVLFGENNISLVEWPSRVGKSYFGTSAISVMIEKLDDNKRKIVVED